MVVMHYICGGDVGVPWLPICVWFLMCENRLIPLTRISPSGVITIPLILTLDFDDCVDIKISPDFLIVMFDSEGVPLLWIILSDSASKPLR